MKKEIKKIRTTNGHCWMTFENGYTISIFNGYGSYSENHYNWTLAQEILEEIPEPVSASNDCEIAIIHNGEFCTRQFIDTDDDVKGYIKPDELAEIIYKVKNYGEIENEINDK